MENHLFPFCSVPPLAPQPVVPKTSKKEQFPFSPGPKMARMAVHEAQSPHSRPPLLSPVGSRVRFKNTMPHAPPAQPWSQASVALCTQTPHWDTLPSGSGPCVPLHCPTAAASVVPLVQLVQSLGAWLALPDGLAGSREPSDLAMRFSSPGALLSPGAFASPLCRTRMLRSCVTVLLAKDAIQPVPPAEMRAGFYSPYFIVSKKGGELQPILDLCVLNQALHKLPFRMLTQKRIFQCIRRGTQSRLLSEKLMCICPRCEMGCTWQSMHANCHWLVLLTLEGDWALGRDPIYVSHYDVTSPIPPSGNEGYLCNGDVILPLMLPLMMYLGNADARYTVM